MANDNPFDDENYRYGGTFADGSSHDPAANSTTYDTQQTQAIYQHNADPHDAHTIHIPQAQPQVTDSGQMPPKNGGNRGLIVAVIVGVIAVLIALAALAYYVATGGGATPHPPTTTITTTAQPTRQASPETAPTTVTATTMALAVHPPAGSTLCPATGGGGFFGHSAAGPSAVATSCEFAESVREQYNKSADLGKAADFTAQSPALGALPVHCDIDRGLGVCHRTDQDTALVYLYK